MTQLNIRIDARVDEILSFLAAEKGISKALVAKELLSQGLNNLLFPLLAQLYQQGKISVKKIIALTNLRPVEVLEKLAAVVEKSAVTPEIDEYTAGVADKVIAHMLKKQPVPGSRG